MYMAYESTGVQTMYPVYFSRMAGADDSREQYDVFAAQNEGNLNQNLEILYRKIVEIEAFLSAQA